ncbi:MAG: hypothetical protein ACLFV3_09890 [Phycisphaeraceae bacterium]
MAEIEIGKEVEEANRWSYDVRLFAGGKTRDYHVTLSWQDYDHWSRGRVAPSRVVEAAFEFLLDHEPAEAILPRFDCSLIRRYFPEVDAELPKRI